MWSSQNLPSSSTDTAPPTHTQPENEPHTDVWGVLYPALQVTHLFKTVSFNDKGSKFIIGRDNSCHYKITLQDGFDKSNDLIQYFAAISKQHFIIQQIEDDSPDGYSVQLTDLSSNGTFVNRSRVGKDKTVELTSCSVIALAGVDNDAFVFVNTKDLAREEQQLPTEFKQKYRLERHRLGAGANGVVRRGCFVESELLVAVKLIEKKTDSQFTQDVVREAELMRRLQHDHIIKIHDVFETVERVYTVLEYAGGGDLCDYILHNGAINEGIVVKHLLDLLDALHYLHTQLVVHRDLKPENILLTSMITDFGLSRLFTPTSMMSSLCGTPMYIAPEVFHNKYTEKVDVWSLGCVVFVMLSGTTPFPDNKPHLARQGKFKFEPEATWSGVSPLIKMLISDMLKVDVEERISVEEALEVVREEKKEQEDEREEERGMKRYLSSDNEANKRKCGN